MMFRLRVYMEEVSGGFEAERDEIARQKQLICLFNMIYCLHSLQYSMKWRLT